MIDIEFNPHLKQDIFFHSCFAIWFPKKFGFINYGSAIQILFLILFFFILLMLVCISLYIKGNDYKPYMCNKDLGRLTIWTRRIVLVLYGFHFLNILILYIHVYLPISQIYLQQKLVFMQVVKNNYKFSIMYR